jgi:hypothetical protein
MTRANSIRNREGKSAARNRSMAASAERSLADLKLRKSGILVMDSLPWGAHICVFYETKEDLLDTAISYFEAGLESNEFCVWAVSDPISLEEATNSVRRVIPDGDRYGTVIGNFWKLPTSSRRSRRSRNSTARWTSCRSRFRAMGY